MKILLLVDCLVPDLESLDNLTGIGSDLVLSDCLDTEIDWLSVFVEVIVVDLIDFFPLLLGSVEEDPVIGLGCFGWETSLVSCKLFFSDDCLLIFSVVFGKCVFPALLSDLVIEELIDLIELLEVGCSLVCFDNSEVCNCLFCDSVDSAMGFVIGDVDTVNCELVVVVVVFVAASFPIDWVAAVVVSCFVDFCSVVVMLSRFEIDPVWDFVDSVPVISLIFSSSAENSGSFGVGKLVERDLNGGIDPNLNGNPKNPLCSCGEYPVKGDSNGFKIVERYEGPL